jgi:hypothetical protein
MCRTRTVLVRSGSVLRDGAHLAQPSGRFELTAGSVGIFPADLRIRGPLGWLPSSALRDPLVLAPKLAVRPTVQ